MTKSAITFMEMKIKFRKFFRQPHHFPVPYHLSAYGSERNNRNFFIAPDNGGLMNKSVRRFKRTVQKNLRIGRDAEFFKTSLDAKTYGPNNPPSVYYLLGNQRNRKIHISQSSRFLSQFKPKFPIGWQQFF